MVVVAASSRNAGLSGLSVNVHRLHSACGALLGLTFDVPAMTVTIDDDDTDRADAICMVEDDDAPLPPLLDRSRSGGGTGSNEFRKGCSVSSLGLDFESQPTDSAHTDTAGTAGTAGTADTVRPDSQAAAETQTSQSSQSQNQGQGHLSLSLGLKQTNRRGGAEMQRFAQDLANMPHADLVALCFEQQRKLLKSDGVRKTNSLKVGRLQRRCNRLEKDVEKLRTDANDSFAVAKRGKQMPGRGGRFTVASWFSIGLRKSLSTIAATDFGLTAMVDISGQTVLRCEQKTSGALVHCFRLFMAEALDFIVTVGGNDPASCDGIPIRLHGVGPAKADPARDTLLDSQSQPLIPQVVDTLDLRSGDGSSAQWSLLTVAFTNDSTTSNIWRRKKLNILDCKVQWVNNFDALLKGDFEKAVVTRQCT